MDAALKRTILRTGRTQRELTKELGWPDTIMSMYIHGHRRMPAARREALSALLVRAMEEARAEKDWA